MRQAAISMNAKDNMRKVIRNKLSQISLADYQQASEQICQHLSSHELLHGNTHIAIYAAHQNEISLASLHELLPDKKLLYPLCQSGSQLTFHHVINLAELTPGKYDILEPAPQKHREVPIDTIDLFFCPGLAFDKHGNRLGQGAGYYDRALEKRNPKAKLIGIGMDSQMLANIPSEPHDIQMDYLTTESGVSKTF